MVSVSEFWKTWQEGFANKDSSKLAEFLIDDFQFIRPAGGVRTRQDTLDWTAAGGSPTTIDDNLEVLYENDDVAVIVHGVNGDGSTVMGLYTKRDDKISEIRNVQQVL